MRLAALLLVSVVVNSACGSSTSQEEPVTPAPLPPQMAPAPPPPPPPPVEVSLRVIHAAAMARAAGLTATVAAAQGAPTSVAADLAFGTGGAYTSATLAPAARSLNLSVEAEGFDPLSDSGAVTAGDPHTAIVFSTPDGGTALAAAIAHDTTEAADSGTTKVRFFNAVVGWDEVDVCTPGATAREAATPLFPAATYGQMNEAGYTDLPAGVQKVQVREANPDAPCTSRVLGVAELAPPEGATLDAKNVTLVAVGRGAGRPAVPRALLLCLDSPTTPPACASQPMRAR